MQAHAVVGKMAGGVYCKRTQGVGQGVGRCRFNSLSTWGLGHVLCWRSSAVSHLPPLLHCNPSPPTPSHTLRVVPSQPPPTPILLPPHTSPFPPTPHTHTHCTRCTPPPPHTPAGRRAPHQPAPAPAAPGRTPSPAPPCPPVLPGWPRCPCPAAARSPPPVCVRGRMDWGGGGEQGDKVRAWQLKGGRV